MGEVLLTRAQGTQTPDPEPGAALVWFPRIFHPYLPLGLCLVSFPRPLRPSFQASVTSSLPWSPADKTGAFGAFRSFCVRFLSHHRLRQRSG